MPRACISFRNAEMLYMGYFVAELSRALNIHVYLKLHEGARYDTFFKFTVPRNPFKIMETIFAPLALEFC